jgi:hypothetical protein
MPKVSQRVMIAKSSSGSCIAVFMPSRNEVSHDGKPICNQLLRLGFSGLVFLSCSYCPVYQPTDAGAVSTCLEEFFLNSAID